MEVTNYLHIICILLGSIIGSLIQAILILNKILTELQERNDMRKE